jgi:nitroreductase
MAVMTLLLAAEDRGLGALFFAVSRNEDVLRAKLGVPAGLQLLGAIALGWPSVAEERVGRSAARRRRAPDEIVHRNRW